MSDFKAPGVFNNDGSNEHMFPCSEELTDNNHFTVSINSSI